MGSSSSKVGRTLPTKARSSGVQGRNTEPPRPPLAKEVKDQEIETDGKDPQLLANLTRMGQVNVQSPGAMFQTGDAKANRVSALFKARELAEQRAASARPVRNSLGAAALSNLLDDRKRVTSQAALEGLAEKYTVDVSVLERLATFINSPSIEDRTVVRTIGDDGQEKVTLKAVWLEPAALQ